MKLTEKAKIIKENHLHKEDTGSAEVQVALLKTKINELSKHLKKNVKDIVSRRVLLKKVAKEKKIQKQLMKQKKEKIKL